MQTVGLYRFFHGIAVSPVWGGVSQIASGNQSVTVSAAGINVQSGAPIMLTRIGSGSPQHQISVDSIVDNVSFAVRCDSGACTSGIGFSWLSTRK